MTTDPHVLAARERRVWDAWADKYRAALKAGFSVGDAHDHANAEADRVRKTLPEIPQ